jgi:CheY-like chemotaxis protein
LGLGIVYEIIKQYSGEIRIESQPGKGTNLMLYLPFTEFSQTIPIESKISAILLVDDNHFIREITADILRKAGYYVMEAIDGMDALSCYRNHGSRVDLLLTDFSMPRMSGGELAQNLQLLQPGIKSLFLSCHGAEACDALVSQGTAFLSKPFTSSMLLNVVSAIVSHPEKGVTAHA